MTCGTSLLEKFRLPTACNPDARSNLRGRLFVHDEADTMSVYVLLDCVRRKYQSFLFLCTSVRTGVSAGGIKAWFVGLSDRLSLHASCLDKHSRHTRPNAQQNCLQTDISLRPANLSFWLFSLVCPDGLSSISRIPICSSVLKPESTA